MFQPGRLEYRFPSEMNLESLLNRLAAADWWGQVIGPHGSGKSTLIQSLIHLIQAQGRRVEMTTIRASDRRVPWDWKACRDWQPQTQIIVDGYEQLRPFSRLWLKRQCRRTGAGLVITAHESVGFPWLWQTAVSDELACQLVSKLSAEHGILIPRAEVVSCLRSHGGNLREVFFDLYDRFEERAR